MEKLRENKFTFLNATHIKLFALLLMTIDHIGYFGFDTPPINDYYGTLRLIGRIAAPLFLYFVVEGVKHTRNKKKFLIRLYIASVCIGLANWLVVNFVFGFHIRFGNILQTFAWTVLLIIASEEIIKHLKIKNWKKASIYTFCTVAFIFIVCLLEELIGGDYFKIFLCSPGKADYSLLFILMGIAWYYTDSKIVHSLILFVPCVISFFGLLDGVNYCNLVQGNQWGMIGAIPLLLLYNGNRGKGMKYFFYIYYPLHAYVLAMLFYGVN